MKKMKNKKEIRYKIEINEIFWILFSYKYE